MDDFMKWALVDGQPMAETLGYARLPDSAGHAWSSNN